MRKNMKLTSLMAIVTVMALLIGSLAFFTDRVAANATVTTMPTAVDVVPVDPGNNDKEIDLTDFWGKIEGNAQAKVNYNPGDRMDLSYDLKNKGSMPVTVRETIIITSGEPMTDGAPEFVLCSSTTAGTYGGFKAVGSLATKVSTTQYKYTTVSDSIAAGSVVDKAYFVVFNENADNDFQGVTCTINYLVEALQADGSWTEIAEATLSNGTWTGGAPAA